MDNVVRYQSLVTVEMEDGKVLQFKIVWSWEVDIFAQPQQISFDSPIWAAIEWHKKWDIVSIKLTQKTQGKIVDVQ
jgi:transcription elongation GreA/GreB family factor